MDNTTAIVWVIIERSNGAFRQTTSRPVLHRADCRIAQRANPENVEVAFGGPQTEAWVWNNGFGFDRACRTCVGWDI